MARHTLSELVEGVRNGERLAIARALTQVENGEPDSWALLKQLRPDIGGALRVGLTGPPGAGKSTLADALVRELSRRGHKLGVVAVDPSSPFSGGALLGDRVRLLKATENPDVFVRSMASRGCLGGLARTTAEAADILDAAGKDIVVIETVGVGQSELAVASACDLTVVILVPESGGMVQAMKAGLMEIADLFVVNKSDRPGSDEMKFQLIDASRYLIWEGRRPSVLMTSAISDLGVPELADEVLGYREWLQEGGRKEKKRRDQTKVRIRELVRSGLEERFLESPEVQEALDNAAEEFRAEDGSLVESARKFWNSVRSDLSRSDIV